MINYNIMIISSVGSNYDETHLMGVKKFKQVDSMNIIRLENIGTLDITHLLKEIYLGSDGIFVIIKGILKGDEFISEFNSFSWSINEVNRILSKFGLGDQRIKLFKLNGKNNKDLIESFRDFFELIVLSEPNPINTDTQIIYKDTNNGYNFNNIPIKKLLYAMYKASYNYQYRSLFKAKEKILNSRKYNEIEYIHLLDSIFEAETARKCIFEELKKYKSLTLKEIINLFDFSEENIIRDIFYLKEQGYIEEVLDNELNNINSLEFEKAYHKYRIKEIKESYSENYFKSVSIIHDNKVCCHCGLCSSICPVDSIQLTRDYVYIDEGKCITCGLCYSICPQSFSIDNLQNLIKKIDNSLNYSQGLGYYKDIFSARTLKYAIKKVGQDGGIVTSILYYLFCKNLIDAVITIKHSNKYWKPKISIIEKVEDLYKTAGTTYVHAPILSILDQIKKYKKIAIVALPCKIKALFKGELFPVKLPLLNHIKYKIGLFCKECFSYEKILKLFSDKFSVEIDEIVKMDINRGKFVIALESGEIFSHPLKECDLYGSYFCNYCNDFAAELADISVGSIGSKIGWSSVIIRTKKGKEVFKGAIKNGLIENKRFIDKKPLQLNIEKQAEIKRDNSRPIQLNIF
ncbi:MAG: Coenzyme F420 hydrogenase/dehydrogenase, beta subunit C-terminal domain [Promethearchaeota archaeon]